MKPYNIELHIEELVLHGFAPGDRHAISAAIQGELTRLFAEQGIHPALQRGFELEKVDGGTFNMKQGTRAEGIGAQVGQAVYDGLDSNIERGHVL
jgi:hypothetical protein